MDNQELVTPVKNGKGKVLLSIVDKRVRAIIAILMIVLSFAFFGALLILNVPDPKREIVVFILGNVTSYISLVLSFFFGSSEDRDRSHNTQNQQVPPEIK
jgi:hypothetical protein